MFRVKIIFSTHTVVKSKKIIYFYLPQRTDLNLILYYLIVQRSPFFRPVGRAGGDITATIGQVSGSSAGMVSKQTGKVEKASSVTIAAGRVENAMLGFRERHAAAARPTTSQRPRKDHCRRHRCVLHFAVVLVGPHGLAECG